MSPISGTYFGATPDSCYIFLTFVSGENAYRIPGFGLDFMIVISPEGDISLKMFPKMSKTQIFGLKGEE